MISSKKINTLKVWENNIFAEYTVSEIMRYTGKKTKTWTFNTLKMLAKNQIVRSEKKGNIDIYRLNINSPIVIQTLQYIKTQEYFNFPHTEIISKIIETTPLKSYSLLVFGSYANNKQTKKSDLDLCFLIENKEDEKKIKPYLNDIKLNTLIEIDEHYITHKEFEEMLIRHEENLGKQIFRSHKIFFNADIYYQLLKEAHNHGFRP